MYRVYLIYLLLWDTLAAALILWAFTGNFWWGVAGFMAFVYAMILTPGVLASFTAATEDFWEVHPNLRAFEAESKLHAGTILLAMSLVQFKVAGGFWPLLGLCGAYLGAVWVAQGHYRRKLDSLHLYKAEI